jgi:hypothetical protein
MVEIAYSQCLWCGNRFRPRQSGGSPQKFCRSGHRHEFFGAARKWAILAIEKGLITAKTLRLAQSSMHGVLEGISPRGIPCEGSFCRYPWIPD